MQDWRLLGDEIELKYGRPLPSEYRCPDGKYAVFGANGEKDRADRALVSRPGIIIGRKGSAGEVTLADEPFWPLDVTYYVSFDDKRHDLQYLYYLLSSLSLPRLAKGVKPGINRNEVYAERAFFPSLAEQRRIVAVLDKAFAAIAAVEANTEKNRRSSRELYASELDRIFGVEALTWPVRELQDVCTLYNGRAYKRHELMTNGPTPVLRVGNFFTNKNWFYSDLQLEPTKYCDNGDLLYAWSASFGPRIWDGGQVIYHYHIWKIEPVAELVTKEFLYHFLDWDKELLKKEQGTGATMVHVTKTSMEARRIPVPDVAEQRRVTERISLVATQSTKLESTYEYKLALSAELKQSILHRALHGDLTPAEELAA